MGKLTRKENIHLKNKFLCEAVLPVKGFEPTTSLSVKGEGMD